MHKRTIALWMCMAVASLSHATETYTVKAGDNDYSIARALGIELKELHRLNPDTNWDRIHPGDKLNIPSKAKKGSASTSPANPTNRGTYKVQKGDNSWTISQKYGISEAKLKELNPDVSFSPLQVGVTLVVPGKGTAAPAAKPQPKPEAPKAQSTIPDIKTENAMTTSDAVIVRSGPSTNSSRLTTVGKFQIGKILQRKDDWYQLQFNWGGKGWVRGDLLSATDKELPPPPKAQPAPKPATPAPKAVGSSAALDSLLRTAKDQIGIRYVYGGTSRGGFDCSGFTRYVFAKNGISLPRTAAEQWTVGTNVSRSSLKPGDLLFFRTRGSRISHVGLYIGNNQFIHASSGGGRIRINDLSGYYARTYAGARRVSSKFASTVAVADWKYDASIEPRFSTDPEPLPEDVSPKSNLGADTISK